MVERKITESEKDNLEFTEKLENMKQYAKAVDDILRLVDLTSSTTKVWTVFSKDNLRSYLQNPYAYIHCRSLYGVLLIILPAFLILVLIR